MSKPPRGNGSKSSRLAADLAARLRAIGKKGAQLHVQKSFPPQLTTIMGDIEVARRFAIMHHVVTDPDDVVDLWSKRGAISGKGVLQQTIKTFLANAKRNGDFDEPIDHHQRMIGPVLQALELEENALRQRVEYESKARTGHPSFVALPSIITHPLPMQIM